MVAKAETIEPKSYTPEAWEAISNSHTNLATVASGQEEADPLNQPDTSSGIKGQVETYNHSQNQEIQADSSNLEKNALINEVKATIVEINDTNVIVNCYLPNDTIALNLSKSIIPSELAKYGTPIRISIENVNGYKQPVIKYREPEHISSFDEELHELRQWIDRL